MKLFAKVTIGGQEHDRIPVLNPGNWFGKTWLIEIGGCYSPLFLIVEADSVTDAIDELADNDTYGHHVIVSEEDLKDYDLDDCYFDGCGRVLDLDHLAVHGAEHSVEPYRCRYYGSGLPSDGVSPRQLDEFELFL